MAKTLSTPTTRELVKYFHHTSSESKGAQARAILNEMGCSHGFIEIDGAIWYFK